MKPPATRCQCLHCRKFFVPNYRNRGRQKYCSSPACRRASKQLSQRRWLSQPGNQDYFSGPENVKRVQQWRAEHHASAAMVARVAKPLVKLPVSNATPLVLNTTLPVAPVGKVP